jgi:hypothetical protein
VFRYGADDYNIAAFARLSLGQVFFRLGPIDRISVRAIWLRSPGLNRETFNLVLQSLQRWRQTERLAWLAAMAPEEPPALHTVLPY